MRIERLSPHFMRQEFRCRGPERHCNCCNGSAPVDYRLIIALEELRDRIKKPIVIVSGFRCEKYNSWIGGSKESQHCVARAADIKVDGMTPDEVAEYAEMIEGFRNGGIGIYDTFTHVDVRPNKRARWRG